MVGAAQHETAITDIIAMALVLGGTDRWHVRHHRPHHVVPAGEPGEDAIEAGVDVGLVGYYEDQQRMTVMGDTQSVGPRCRCAAGRVVPW